MAQNLKSGQDKYLIVVDMQNDFVSGSLGTEEAKKIVLPVSQRIGQFTGNVAFTMDTHQSDYLSTQEGALLPVEHCMEGTWGWQLVPQIKELQEKRNAPVYRKPIFGCVELAQELAAAGHDKISEIELVGLCTDICVISNAVLLRNMLPDVPIYVDASCCAGVTQDKHEAALKTMESCQIRIRNWQKVNVLQ